MRNSPNFKHPVDALSYSLDPSPNKINPVHAIPSYLFKIHFNIILRPYACLHSGIRLSGLPTQTLYSQIVNKNYELFHSLLLTPPLQVHILSSTPYSQTPSTHVLPLI